MDILQFVPFLFHVFESGDVEYFLLHFLEDFDVVDLNEHSFAHPHIAHQNRGFLNVLHHYKLSPRARQIFFSAELIIAFLHLSVDHQSVGFCLSHLLHVNVHLNSAAEVLLEGKEVPMVVVKNVLL